MTFDRRDFFGVIAAPLLRKLVPPVPMAKDTVTIGNMTFATIANVRSISGPSIKPDAEFWRKKTATLLDAGSISFDIHFVPPDGRL